VVFAELQPISFRSRRLDIESWIMVRFIICIALLLALSRHAAAADAERSFVDVGLQQVIVIKSLSTNVRLAQVLSMDGLFVTAPDVASASTRSIQKRLRDHLLKRL